jgi:hypothetical protein
VITTGFGAGAAAGLFFRYRDSVSRGNIA